METDGTVKWYKQFEDGGIGSNMCRGLAYHENIQILAALFEFNRVEGSGKYEVYILLFETTGRYLDGVRIKQKNFFKSDPQLAPRGIVSHPESLSFFFAGGADGYKTRY